MNENDFEKDDSQAISDGEADYEFLRRQKLMRVIFVIGGIFAASLIFVAAWFLFLRGDDEAGKPVPAPRSTSFDQSSAALPAGQTLTLTMEQLRNAGLKIESVGEQLSAVSFETSATGTVQPNSYRETPVISVASGIVRRVVPELGENVSRGETLAVVFSDEFASAQSRYVALRTELENAQKNFERTQKLVIINQPGRTEVDSAAKELKSAQAQLDEMQKRLQRTQRLLEIGAASREELEQDTTKIRVAEAQVEEAQKRFDRSKEILDINPESRSAFEDASNKVRNAESDLASVKEKLILYGMPPARIASLRSASQINSELSVIAPTSGTLTARGVNVGEVIESNKELMRVTDLSSVWVVAQVYEKDLARLRVGSGASVTSDAFPDRLFRGHITYIDPSLEEATRTAQVRIELENPQNLLKIGMYVKVALGALGQAERTSPSIPASAVQNLENRQIVFVAGTDPSVFEIRAVRLGTESSGRVQVLEGLSVGERIVTDGSFLLRAEWTKLHSVN